MMTQCLNLTQNVALEFCLSSLIFVVLKVTCLVTLFDFKLQVFKKSPKLTIFGLFNELYVKYVLFIFDILIGQKLIRIPKMVNFDEFLKA